jgi:peptide/nickel transport system substrate-binding protein
MSLTQRYRSLIVGALAISLAAALTACAGANAASSGPSLTTLTIADPAYPSSLDPSAGQTAYNQYYDLSYAPLIVQEADGGFAPGLATSWQYGANNESFEITLRPGVEFSDGSALNSAAVKTWIDYELKVPGGSAPGYLGALTSIDTPDTTHLTLHFSAPTPQLPLVFSQALEMGMIGSPEAVAAGTLATRTDGAGEYVLDSSATVVGDHYTYLPNPHYWDPSAIHWKKVVIRYMASLTTTLQALQAGQVQLAVQQQADSIGADPEGLNVTDPMQDIFGLSFDDRTGSIVPALGNLKVRQAINDAIDRVAVNRAVVSGYGQPTDEVSLPGDDGYVASLESEYPYDPATARRLLAEAGYPHGFTMRILDGPGQLETLAEAIAGELANVGIKVQLVQSTTAGDYFNKLASGKYEASILEFGSLPAYFMYGLLFGPNATQFNPLKTSSSALNADFQAMLPLSEAAAKPYAQAMVTYVTEQAWFAPLISTPFVGLSTKNIAGMQAHTDGRRFWYLPEVYPVG